MIYSKSILKEKNLLSGEGIPKELSLGKETKLQMADFFLESVATHLLTLIP